MKIGAFEAKSQFSSLLDRASRGEEVIITKHGKSVAKLIGMSDSKSSTAASVFAELKRLRQRTTLDLSWKELRDEGRK